DGAAFAYASFGHLERPAVGIAVGILPAGDEGGRYRIWAGAICDRPTRLATVEAALADVPPAALGDVLAEAAREGAAALETHDDLHGSADYKQHLAGVLIRRAVAEAAATASRFGATP